MSAAAEGEHARRCVEMGREAWRAHGDVMGDDGADGTVARWRVPRAHVTDTRRSHARH